MITMYILWIIKSKGGRCIQEDQLGNDYSSLGKRRWWSNALKTCDLSFQYSFPVFMLVRKYSDSFFT